VESCLPFISGLDAYIIEAPTDVEFCEVLGSAELRDEFGNERERVSVLDGYGIQHTVVLDQLRDEFGNERERVSVLDGYGIQHTVVLDQLERTIFLLNEEHRGCDRGF